MGAEVLGGVGDVGRDIINAFIPEPDVTIWMGNKTSREQGRMIAQRVAAATIPLLVSTFMSSIGRGLRGFVSGGIGVGVAAGVSLLSIGKAYLVNKVADRIIKPTSQFHPIKDEIKKVVDSSLSVALATAYVVAACVVPLFGSIALFSAAVNLATTIGTLAKSSYELHEKRHDPAIQAQMIRLRNANAQPQPPQPVMPPVAVVPLASSDARLAAERRRLPQV